MDGFLTGQGELLFLILGFVVMWAVGFWGGKDLGTQRLKGQYDRLEADYQAAVKSNWNYRTRIEKLRHRTHEIATAGDRKWSQFWKQHKAVLKRLPMANSLLRDVNMSMKGLSIDNRVIVGVLLSQRDEAMRKYNYMVDVYYRDLGRTRGQEAVREVNRRDHGSVYSLDASPSQDSLNGTGGRASMDVAQIAEQQLA